MEGILELRCTLIHVLNLDLLVGCAGCKNDTLQNAMLEWVAMLVFLQHARKSTDPMSMGKLKEFTQTAKVAVYLRNTFAFQDEADVTHFPADRPLSCATACCL